MGKAFIRLLALVVLLLTGTDAWGGVKVDIDTFAGGTVEEKSQGEPAADGSVTVTITVTPAAGYEIAKSDISVAATLPIEQASTRGPQIAMMLVLEGDDPADLSESRDYTVTVGQGLGIWVMEANFHRKGDARIEAGLYRICHGNSEKWYLWPSVTADGEGHPYLTTFNDVKALAYSSAGVTYEAFGEQYSLWQVTPVEAADGIYYQLFNIGLQQYAVWSAAQGEKAVHMEASPADITHTYFRFDGEAAACLITPSEADAGTTLNSKFGDKPYLSATNDNTAEPDHVGSGGLMQVYANTPVWTLERGDNSVSMTFQKTSDDGRESVALFVPAFNLALPDGITAWMVTGVDLRGGAVVLQQVSYMPQDMPLLLLTENEVTEMALLPKDADTPVLTDEAKSVNLLRVGSPTVQPTPYEDYIFFRGEFVMVSGGTLSTGKVFLDLNSEQSAATRGVIGIGGPDGTTGITAVKRQAGATESRWYSLDGRRLDGHPSRKGIYIHDGRKVVIK